MRVFRFRNIMPAGGYRYTVPETGESFLTGDLRSLVREVAAHYERNLLTRPSNLAAIIEHDICLHAPPDFCRGTFEAGDHQQTPISPIVIREASQIHKTRLKWPESRFIAPDAEVARRVDICKICPENAKGYCTTCNGLGGMAKRIVGDRAERYEAELGVCRLCQCLLPVKVFISAEALRAVKSGGGLPYPKPCWMTEVFHGQE